MKQTENKIVFCIEVLNPPNTNHRWFLYQNGGDWGPRHSLTVNLAEADHWNDYENAIEYYKTNGRGIGYNIRIVKVEISSTFVSTP